MFCIGPKIYFISYFLKLKNKNLIGFFFFFLKRAENTSFRLNIPQQEYNTEAKYICR